MNRFLALALVAASMASCQESAPVRRFAGDCFVSSGGRLATAECLVARDEEGWARILERIPETEIHPSEIHPNTDPIREARIDFSRHMVLFLSRPGTVMTPPVVESVESARGLVVVRYGLPRPEISAHPVDRGAYVAIVVERTDGEVLFQPGEE